ncbi:MAG: carboxymuconolactone decarboxylase family protein [bacterium]
MKELHGLYTQFRAEFPEIMEKNEALGEFVHEHGGPLDEKTRCLVKLGISAASHHKTAVSTHLGKAREAGASDAEIMHALLLVIPTCGFPTFMEAYREYKGK